jgi:hypothetical protein
MAIRFYVLPLEVNPAGARRPKYIHWRGDTDPALLRCPVYVYAFGLINAGLMAAGVSAEQHDRLASHADVAAAPADLDETIGAGALAQAQAALEALRVPAEWVTTAHTYRQVLRALAGLFQFAKRHHALHGEPLIESAAQLDLRWNEIPAARRDRLQATAAALRYDTSAVQPAWLVRRSLKHLGDQWGARAFDFGFTTL